jgi:NDP-sugar pyrophosphorylase family protein
MINIVVPMAGLGSRFAAGSDSVPKPFIEVVPGRMMVGYAIDYLRLDAPHRFVFICRTQHVAAFALHEYFAVMAGRHVIVETATVTRGPAASALLAASAVDEGEELLIAYCDSFLTIEMSRYLSWCRTSGVDGVLLTYPSDNPADAFVRIVDGAVLEVAEKRRIGPVAASGQYYFRRAGTFFDAARRMIARAGHSAEEFFVSDVFNELLSGGASVAAYSIAAEEKIELGTPEDLACYRASLAVMESPCARRISGRRPR